MLRVIALAILLWGSVPMESLARAETSSPLLKIFPAEGFSKIVTVSSSTEDICPKPADCYAPKPGDVVETGTPLTPVLSRTFLLEILRAYQSEARAYAARLEAAQGDHDSPLVASLEAKLHLLSESELLLQRLKGKPESSVAKLRAQEQKLLAQEPILLHRDIQEWIRKRSTKKLPWKSILADQLKASSHFSDLLEKSIARVEMGCVSTQEVCASENLGAPPIGDTEFFEIVRHVLYWPQWSPRLAPGTKEAICSLRKRLPPRYGLMRNSPDPSLQGVIRRLVAGSESTGVEPRPILLATDPKLVRGKKETGEEYSNYLIRIKSENPKRDAHWFERVCSMVQNQLFQARKKFYDQAAGAQEGAPLSAELARLKNVTCVRDETMPEYRKLRSSRDFKYEFSVQETLEGAMTFGFENLAPRDPTEIGAVTIPFSYSGKLDLIEKELGHELQKRVLFFVPRGQEAIQENALKILAQNGSTSVAWDPKGKWIDKRTKKELLFDDALRLFQKEGPQRRHWLRALMETFGFLGVQAGVFYAQCEYQWKVLNLPGYQRGTWDFGLNDVGKKFTGLHGLGVDDNDFMSNARGHPIDGAIYYAFARNNGFSVPESLLFSAISSGLWEYFGELRQQASTNDLTVTPLAGMAVGEAFINIGAYAGKGDPTKVLPRIFQYVFNALEPFHDSLDKNHTRRNRAYDKYGFPAELKHSFQAILSAGAERRGGQTHEVNQAKLDLEVVNIPNTDQPGSDRKIFYDGNLSRIIVSYGLDTQSAKEFKAAFSSVLLGFYQKKIELDQACRKKGGTLDECKKGYSLATGVKTRFDFETRRGQGDAKDPDESIALCTIMGQSLDITFFHKGLKLRAVADVYADYAMIRNFAVDQVPVDQFKNEIQSSIVEADRYYHGLGVSTNTEINMEYKNFILKSSAAYDYIHSAFNAFDRYRYIGVNPTDAEKDERLILSVGLGYQFLNGLLETGLEYTHTDRLGETVLLHDGVKTPYRNEQTTDLVTGNLKVKF